MRTDIIYDSIDGYHANQPVEYRNLLDKLRQVIKEEAPKAIEVISYRMPAFKQNKVLVYYAINKKHLGFYPTPNAVQQFSAELESFNTSKGAIQFPLNKPIPFDLIRRIVRFRVEEDAALKQATTQKGTASNIEPPQDAPLNGIFHELPEDMIVELKSNKPILERWNKLTPIQRNEWICWVTIVKKQEIRKEHIKRMLEEIEEGQRKPCCWPGCPHRNPAARKWFKNFE